MEPATGIELHSKFLGLARARCYQTLRESIVANVANERHSSRYHWFYPEASHINSSEQGRLDGPVSWSRPERSSFPEFANAVRRPEPVFQGPFE